MMRIKKAFQKPNKIFSTLILPNCIFNFISDAENLKFLKDNISISTSGLTHKSRNIKSREGHTPENQFNSSGKISKMGISKEVKIF